MRYLSVCSGIEAASVAWEPLGWTAAAFSEIEAFPRAVLTHRFPNVPLHGDFTTIRGTEYGPVDLLVGGTPCQSFSVAGLRKGMDDPRGNLALGYLGLASRLGARWVVWENVPGVLSSNGGRDFGAFLGGLAQLGYGFAYRVLDAQFFGVPQRRRRVFVVGHLGDWRRAAAVLFERHSLSGNPPPSREAGKAAPTLPSRSSAGGGLGTDFDCDGGLIHVGNTSPTLNTGDGSEGQWLANDGALIAHTLRADGFDASEDGTGRGTPLVPIGFTNRGFHAESGAETLRAGSHGALPMVAHTLVSEGDAHSGFRDEHGLVPVRTYQGDRVISEDEPWPTLPAQGCNNGGGGGAILMPRNATAVRRITPMEAERLQGFPDLWTLVPYRGKPAADGPRYKALGNSMAVPCMEWIGSRMSAVEALSLATETAA